MVRSLLLSAMVCSQVLGQPEQDVEIEIDGPPPGMLFGGPGPVIMGGRPGHMRGGPPGLMEIDGPPGHGVPLEEMMELGGPRMRGGPPGLMEIDGPPGRHESLEEMMELGGPHMRGGPPGLIEIDGPPGRGGPLSEMMALGGARMRGAPPGLIEIDGPPPGEQGEIMMLGGPSMMEGSPGSLIELDSPDEEGGEMIIGGPQMPGIGPGGGEAEVVIEQDGDGPPRVVSESGDPAFFRDLLPGPLPGQRGPPHSRPFGDAPDAMVLNMLKDMGSEFNNKVLPKVRINAGSSSEPGSCRADSVKHCKSFVISQIHCLGQHSSDISEKCRKDIGKSVPFVCSKFIDRYCDLLDNSILKCLWDQKRNLNTECLDAVTATRRIPQSVHAQSKTVSSKAAKASLLQNSKLAHGPAAIAHGTHAVANAKPAAHGQSEWSFWKSLFGKHARDTV
jgi:hypothetical protein